MEIELISMLVFELDYEGFLLGRVERLVVSDASVKAEFVVRSGGDEGKVDWVGEEMVCFREQNLYFV